MKAALIGISGWGGSILRVLREMDAAGEIELVAVSDIQYEQNREKIEELAQRGVRYYRDYTEMLAKEKTVGFVAIATPIHLHRPMGIAAMEAGFHVFLEKPPAVTVQEVDALIETSERTGRLCLIDFLNSSSSTFLELKGRIAGGEIGEIKTITGIGLWERLDNYYTRTNWAGKLTVNGNYVLDGTVNNPLSHMLNNMMLLAQAAPNEGLANVAKVTAELYHAHEIEGEDNSCVRIATENGVELYFYATLCNDGQETPYIVVEGTKGSAYWDFAHRMKIRAGCGAGFNDLLEEEIDTGYAPLVSNMFRNLIGVASGKEERLYCSAKDTRGFILASNGAFESSGGTHAIPARFISRFPREDSIATHVPGIRELILQAAKQHKLFSEMGVEWAVTGREVDMKDYKYFWILF